MKYINIKKIFTLIIFLLIGVLVSSYIGASVAISAEEVKISKDEAKTENVDLLRYGYNVTAGKAICDDGLQLAYPILEDIDIELYNYIKKFENNTKTTAGNYTANSAVALAQQSGSLLSGGIEAKISIVNVDISSIFNTQSESSITYAERYEVYYQEVKRMEYVIDGTIDLREYLEEKFEKELQAVDSEEDALTLYSKYGTHLFTGFKYGGLMQVSNYIKVSNLETSINNVTSLDSKISTAIGSCDAGTSFSFYEQNQTKEEKNYGTSNYALTLYGGKSVAGVTLDQLFTYNSSWTDGKGNYAYDRWVSSINDLENLAIIGSPDSARQIPLWELLPTNQSNVAKSYLIQAFAKLCGDKYNEFLKKYPSTKNSVIDDDNTEDETAIIFGHTVDYNNNITYYEYNNDTTKYNVSKGSLIQMHFNSSVPQANRDWSVLDGGQYVELIDSKNGVFRVKDTAISGGTFMVVLRGDGFADKSFSFTIKNSSFSGGEGTEEYPYLVSTTEDLATLSSDSQYWGKNIYYKLINNLDLKGANFSGIGNSSKPFSGIFDGGNCEISNFKIQNPLDGSIGLFAYNAGEVKNLTLKDIQLGKNNSEYTNVANYMGALVGYNTGNIENCKVEKLTIDCKFNLIKGSQDLDNISLGGLVGYTGGSYCIDESNFTKIKECCVLDTSFKVNIKDDAWNFAVVASIGGLIGKVDGCEITDCYVNNISTINLYTKAKALENYAGGLIGLITKAEENKVKSSVSSIIVGKIGSIICDGERRGMFQTKENESHIVVGNSNESIKIITSMALDIYNSESENIGLGCPSTGINTGKTFADLDISALSSPLSKTIWDFTTECPTLKKQSSSKTITVNTSNAKVEYFYGEEFSISGVTVSGVYTVLDSSFDIPSFTYDSSKFNSNLLGTYQIYVSAFGQTNSYDVTVRKMSVIGIYAEPLIESAEVGDEANLSDFKVYYILENGDKIPYDSEKLDYVDYKSVQHTDVILDKYSYVSGINNIIIRCNKFTANCIVKATEKALKEIKIVKQPIELKFYEGEDFKTTGIEVMAYYEDGSSKVVNNEDLEIIGKKIIVGDNEIILSYGPYVTCSIDVEGIALYKEYTITFKNWDGTIISSDKYVENSEITIPTPTKEEDETYTYTFIGWDKEVSNICVGDATYTAVFQEEYKEYEVIFKNWDGTVLSTNVYHYGDEIIIPSNPTRPSEVGNTYTFIGWDITPFTLCQGNAVYTAIYSSTIEHFTVIFRNWDETILSMQTYKYGDQVIIPSNPTRPNDESNEYNFIGWDKLPNSTCIGNAEYVAVFNENPIKYIVTFKNWDGTIISQKKYHYGDEISFPETPTRESDDKYEYTFKSWSNESKTVIGNMEITAQFSQIEIVENYTGGSCIGFNVIEIFKLLGTLALIIGFRKIFRS